MVRCKWVKIKSKRKDRQFHRLKKRQTDSYTAFKTDSYTAFHPLRRSLGANFFLKGERVKGGRGEGYTRIAGSKHPRTPSLHPKASEFSGRETVLQQILGGEGGGRVVQQILEWIRNTFNAWNDPRSDPKKRLYHILEGLKHLEKDFSFYIKALGVFLSWF